MEIGVIEAPTVKELFIQRMADMIIKGELKPGDRLPSERELAFQSHISKSAVHLALADLERMGFVETNARHGTYVCDFARNGIETMNVLLRSSGGSFDAKRTKDMLEMRMALEGKALELLAECWNEEAQAQLDEDVRKAEAAEKDTHALAAEFFAFHHDICFFSGNFILPLIFNTFEYVTTAYWEEAVRKLGSGRCIALMREFNDVLKKRDAQVSKACLQKEFDLFSNEVRNQSLFSNAKACLNKL